MASARTGQLDQSFLASTNVIPLRTIKAENRGNRATKLWGRRNQRTWNRPRKGSVEHVVTTPGASRRIRANLPDTLAST